MHIVRDGTPVEMGREYMTARFPVSIWVYGESDQSKHRSLQCQFLVVLEQTLLPGPQRY